MKRLFTLLSAIVMAGTLAAQTALWQQAPQPVRQLKNTHRAVVQGQSWWGYATSSDGLAGLGVRSADTYHCAIFVPGDHSVAGGKTIDGMRFALMAPNASDVSVWIATELPDDLSDPTVVRQQDVDYKGPSEDAISVMLDEPYAIPDDGCYVGYSFTIDPMTYQNDAYPILTNGTDTPNALFIRTETAQTTWIDLYGQGFGVLYLQLLLSGEFEQFAVTPSGIGTVYSAPDAANTLQVTLTNYGTAPVESIDYTVVTDGEEGPLQHLALDEPLSNYEQTTVSISVNGMPTATTVYQMISVTGVNGHDNMAEEPDCEYLLVTLSEILERNVAVEEYTGTGCGWCPRGIVGMEKMRQTFGARFVGIGIHQYNTGDPMYLGTNNYAQVGFTGAPSCKLDRHATLDPYYGSADDICDDFRAEMAVPALAKVALSAVWNSDKTKVDAEATVTALYEDANYSVELVLIADDVKGTGTSWRQQNYYSSQYSSSQLPDDLAPYGKGGSLGTSTITPSFNDVAIASSYASGKNQAEAVSGLSAGQSQTVSYTLSMPTKTTLKSAIKTDKVFAVALIVGPDGTIANSVKVPVTDAIHDGVSSTTVAATAARESYTLDGRRLEASQRGLNIVRTADGRTMKMVVR